MRVAYMVAVLALVAGCDRIPGTSQYKQAMATAAVASKMIDPDAAKFRDVRVVTKSSGDGVCGEVNGKNALGAYTGFTAFVVMIKDGKIDDVSLRPTANPTEAEILNAKADCEKAKKKPGSGMICMRASEIQREALAVSTFELSQKIRC